MACHESLDRTRDPEAIEVAARRGTPICGVPLERVEWPLDWARDHFDAIIYPAMGLEQVIGAFS